MARRMQHARHGPLVDAAPQVELWLDGGRNPAGGEAVAATLARMPARGTHLICGMLNTKDVTGYMRPLAPHVTRLHAVSIPGEKNTLPAEATRDAARAAGIQAVTAGSVRGGAGGDRRDGSAGAGAYLRLAVCGGDGAARERVRLIGDFVTPRERKRSRSGGFTTPYRATCPPRHARCAGRAGVMVCGFIPKISFSWIVALHSCANWSAARSKSSILSCPFCT